MTCPRIIRLWPGPSGRSGTMRASPWRKGCGARGSCCPGGESEVLRYVRPLGLSGAASLLLVGAQGGGPAIAIARQLGVWVSGFESDPVLTPLGAERARTSGLGKRVEVEPWKPDQPAFRAQAYHHGVALEPLHNLATEPAHGGQAEPVLAAIGDALKPGGQLMLLETVADTRLTPDNHEAVAWARMENRRLDLPTEASVTRMLGRLGFDVRVVENLSSATPIWPCWAGAIRSAACGRNGHPRRRRRCWCGRRNYGSAGSICCARAGCAWSAGMPSARVDRREPAISRPQRVDSRPPDP